MSDYEKFKLLLAECNIPFELEDCNYMRLEMPDGEFIKKTKIINIKDMLSCGVCCMHFRIDNGKFLGVEAE